MKSSSFPFILCPQNALLGTERSLRWAGGWGFINLQRVGEIDYLKLHNLLVAKLETRIQGSRPGGSYPWGRKESSWAISASDLPYSDQMLFFFSNSLTTTLHSCLPRTWYCFCFWGFRSWKMESLSEKLTWPNSSEDKMRECISGCPAGRSMGDAHCRGAVTARHSLRGWAGS